MMHTSVHTGLGEKARHIIMLTPDNFNSYLGMEICMFSKIYRSKAAPSNGPHQSIAADNVARYSTTLPRILILDVTLLTHTLPILNGPYQLVVSYPAAILTTSPA